MKSVRIILALSGLITIGLVGCGQPPSKPSAVSGGGAAVVNDPDGDGIDNTTGKPVENTGQPLPMQASLASFKLNLYEPILKPYCSECHSKTFGDEDMAKAHDAFVERSQLGSFPGLDQTAMVQKLKHAHNCWVADAKVCADTIQDKMGLWLKDLEANGYKPSPVKYPNPTAEVLLSAATAAVVTPPADVIGAGVDKATVGAPFVPPAQADVDGAIQASLMAPAGLARAANANINAGQGLTFTLRVPATGPYFIWARVKTTAETDNEFFVRANGGNAVPFIAPVTGGQWKWAQVMVVANNANTANPFSFNVATAGDQTVNVFFREAGAKINYVVITSKPDFNGDLFTRTFKDVTVPLTVAGAPGAKIVATIWEQSVEEGKRSLGVKELRIVDSPVPLHIKKVYPIINGMFSANQGSYTLVDTIAGGPDATKAVISTGGSTASTWLADITKDKLSFAFEVIEVAK